MPECSNPVQCQTSKRDLCTCACGGIYHQKLSKLLNNPETQTQGEELLKELRVKQAELKKVKRTQRRQRRAVERKANTSQVATA